VPEREQADVADEQVEGGGEEAEAQHLHHEHGVEDEGRHREDGDADGGEEAGVLRQAPPRDHGGAQLGLQCHHSLPNRPAGRISSTIAITMKMTVLEACG
jgi:hypothetical protein